jgi:hypothetical protein
VFQPVLPLHECADPAAVEPLHSVAHSTAKPLHFIADSAAEPLQCVVDSIADSATAGAASTETS